MEEEASKKHERNQINDEQRMMKHILYTKQRATRGRLNIRQMWWYTFKCKRERESDKQRGRNFWFSLALCCCFLALFAGICERVFYT